MIIQIWFTFTALISLIFAASVLTKGEISFPSLFIFDWLDPRSWYIMYPSLAYQVWFWANHFNVFN